MIVVGARGFAVQIHDVLYDLSLTEDLVFFDNVSSPAITSFLDIYSVLNSDKEVLDFFESSGDRRFVLGTGGPATRKSLFEKFISLGGIPYTIVAENSKIGHFEVGIGEGVCVLTNSIVESTVTIGKGSLVNLNVSITHHSVVGEFCELSPGVRISGNCKIGDSVFLGTGAIVLPNLKIGNNVIVGAGAVVTKDVDDGLTVIGVPAKPIRI